MGREFPNLNYIKIGDDKMKKAIAIFLAAVTLLSLCACGKKEQEESELPTNVRDEEIEQREPELPDIAWNDEIEQEIVAAYLGVYPNHSENELEITCYGAFNGTYVVVISQADPNTLFHIEEVYNFYYYFDTDCTFDVYRDGKFADLYAAYSHHWLTDDNMLTVQRYHRAGNAALYETYEARKQDRASSVLDEAIEREIIAALVAAHENDRYPVAEDEVSLRCRGAFNGVYVLFVDVDSWDYTTAVYWVVVDDVEFVYPTGQKMTVYYNGSFCSLDEAYENEILSHDDLLTVQLNFNGIYQN